MQDFRQLRRWVLAWIARGAGESGVDHLLRLAVAAVVLLFPAACLLVYRSDSLSLLLLLIVGLTVWARSGFKAGLTQREWLFVAAFAGFFLAGVIAFEFGHQTDSGFRLLGRYLRLLLVFPALVALKRYRPPALLVWSGLGLGAFILGVDAVWERISESGFLRPNGDTNVAILFGDLATLTTCAFAAGYVYIDGRLPHLGPRLMALGVLAGLLACFLSGTRGAWLALPVLLILFLSARHLLHPRAVLASALVVASLFTGLYFLPQAQVRERLHSLVEQLEVYRDVDRSIAEEHAPPLCMDDPALLQAWAAAGLQSPGAALRVDVPTKKGFKRRSLIRHGCEGRGALRLRNDGAAQVWLRLPRIKHPDKEAAAKARLIVSGNAIVKFGRGPASYQHVKRRRGGYIELDLRSVPRFSDTVLLVVPPHATVWLVPVETYVGEYRYTLLRSSIGQRLEMWSVAWRLFQQAPFTGVGTGAYQAEARTLVDAGTAPPVTAEYDHPHSEYFDALSSRGLLGLLAVLALLAIPGWLFSHALDSSDPAHMGASLSGLLVAVGFAIFGFTETMFIHSVTLGWYVIITAVFMALAEAPTGRENGN
jgi:O-antigen ligase